MLPGQTRDQMPDLWLGLHASRFRYQWRDPRSASLGEGYGRRTGSDPHGLTQAKTQLRLPAGVPHGDHLPHLRMGFYSSESKLNRLTRSTHGATGQH